MRTEPARQHTHQLCHCGRPLRAGELCIESYDGHRTNRDADLVATMSRLENTLTAAARQG